MEQLPRERQHSDEGAGASAAAEWDVRVRSQLGGRLCSLSASASSRASLQLSAAGTAAALHAALKAIEAGKAWAGAHSLGPVMSMRPHLGSLTYSAAPQLAD